MSRSNNHPGNQRGLALIEVLVAFAIAALALGVLFSGTLDGLRGARAAARTEEALSHARSRLAVLGHGQPITAGESSGDDGGGFTFHQRIVPAASSTPTGDLTLYAIRLTISWAEDGRDRAITLDTERLIATPGGTPEGTPGGTPGGRR